MLRTSVIVLSATVLAAFTAAAFAADAQGDIWILSGQSNACGRAEGAGLPPEERVQTYDMASHRWVKAQEPLPMMGGSPGTLGPWHAAGLEVAKPGPTIRLMGYASGGMPISHWDDGQGGWTTLGANIKRCGEGARVFLWYQGESDAKDGMDAKTYQAKLAALVAKIRAAGKNPAMLAVIVQLGGWKNNSGDFMPVREAERQFVIADGNAVLVPALGRKMQDYVHLDRDGYLELGKEIGRAILRVYYKRKEVDWPGPVMDAAVAAADGKTVLAHFAEVKKLAGFEAADFGATDAKGAVKCVKIQAENTRLALTFERALTPPAKLIYGFGQAPAATLVDEAGNRAPAVQLDLTAGVVPPDKETSAPNGAGAPAQVKK